MIPFMGETVCRAFNFVFIPVFLLLYFVFINNNITGKKRFLIITTLALKTV